MANLGANKLSVGNQAVEMSKSFMDLYKRMRDLHEFYFDNLFNSGAGDAIIDDDLSSIGLTAAELGDFVNFVAQLDLMMNNGEPFQADWSVNLNKMRTL